MNVPAGKVSVGELADVPETMLWPLWNRAAEARRPDRILDDPLAIELVERIDYAFAARFGRPSILHPIRARGGDDLIRAYCAREPDGVVIALGEGLETQLWRVDDGRVRWFTVDLPEAVAVRRRLLPEHPRARALAVSALDPSWLDAVPAEPPPFLSAAGLLMYFAESDVRALLGRIAERFPGAELFFDTIPPWLSRRTLRGMKVTKRYRAPPMPWGIGLGQIEAFLTASASGLHLLSARTFAEPFPQRTRFLALLSKIRSVRNRIAPGLIHARVLQVR